MKTNALGRTGLPVSLLGLGGGFLSSTSMALEDARATVSRALELGVSYIDTAPGYGDSEETLGRILEDIRAPIMLSTKIGGRPQPFDAQNRDHLMYSIEESLRLLKRDRIDILMIHEPDRPGQYDWWSDKESFDGPVMEVLNELKCDGTIRFIGLGGTTAYGMAHLIETGKFDVVLTAFNYSLLWREAEHEVLPAAKQQNMGIVIGSPLQQGALARRYDDEIKNGAPWLSKPRRAQFKALYELCDELALPLTELAIRWVLSNPDISCVLMGALSPVEVEQNVAAFEKGSLSPEVVQRLNEIAALVPFRPFDEPAGLPFGREYSGPGMMR